MMMRFVHPDPEREIAMTWEEYMDDEQAGWAEEDLAELTDDDHDPARNDDLRLALEEGRLDDYLHYLHLIAIGRVRSFGAGR